MKVNSQTNRVGPEAACEAGRRGSQHTRVAPHRESSMYVHMYLTDIDRLNLVPHCSLFRPTLLSHVLPG